MLTQIMQDRSIKSAHKGEMILVRKLPDGAGEYADYRGRRIRLHLFHCVECERDLPGESFETHYDYRSRQQFRAKICWECRKAERDARSEASHRLRKVVSLQNAAEAVERRSAILALARVKWRDIGAIRAVYSEARRLTAETGIPHDVDHFYPLQSKLCCGLHVHENLRVMKASDNRSKGADFPTTNSPALQGVTREELENWLREVA